MKAWGACGADRWNDKRWRNDELQAIAGDAAPEIVGRVSKRSKKPLYKVIHRYHHPKGQELEEKSKRHAWADGKVKLLSKAKRMPSMVQDRGNLPLASRTSRRAKNKPGLSETQRRGWIVPRVFTPTKPHWNTRLRI